MRILDMNSPEGQQALKTILNVTDERVMPEMKKLDQAWTEGRRAYFGGSGISENRYPNPTLEFESWIDGWEDGHQAKLHFDEGVAAYFNGNTLQENPYSKAGEFEKFDAWEDGFENGGGLIKGSFVDGVLKLRPAVETTVSYLEGVKSFNEGLHRNTNPYHGYDNLSWDKGWVDGREESVSDDFL